MEYHDSSSSRLKYDFSNKVVLITGGTGALGRAITKSFVASNAARTITSYIFDKEIEQLKSEIKTADQSIQIIKADITKEEQVKK